MPEARTLPDVKQRSVAERLKLIEELWDSLDVGAEELADWQRDEIDRRLAALESGQSAGVPRDVARRRIGGLATSG